MTRLSISPKCFVSPYCFGSVGGCHAHELRAMKCCGKRHTPMVGWAPDGRSHGEIAEEYTSRMCSFLYLPLMRARRSLPSWPSSPQPALGGSKQPQPALGSSEQPVDLALSVGLGAAPSVCGACNGTGSVRGEPCTVCNLRQPPDDSDTEEDAPHPMEQKLAPLVAPHAPTHNSASPAPASTGGGVRS